MIIKYEKLKFTGLAGISVQNLRIFPKSIPCQCDTLFSANNLSIRLSAFKLLFLNPDLKELNADNIKINFVKRDSVSNFEFLYRTNRQPNDTLRTVGQVSKQSYSKITDRFLYLILAVLPSSANINNLKVSYIKDSYNLIIKVPAFIVKKNLFSTKITTNENNAESYLYADGILDDSQRKISAKLYSKSNLSFPVPFIGFRWGADVKFETLAFEISGSQRRSDLIILTGKAFAQGISVLHKRVSPENVILKNGEFDFKINVGKNFVELDSSSTAIINNFKVSPYLRAVKNIKWHISASLNKSDFPADELFSSLPKGLFYNLDGIKTIGNLDFHFLIDIDFNSIDSLKFESVLKPNKFRIVSFGNTDFRYINNDFDYTAYEDGVPLKTFSVGFGNHNFRPLDKISPFLQMAVLQSEDGGFFYHNGFLKESIREALAQDIKERRFRRGGSTISMQLVKNLFLSRNKTLARKFEEIMIVWLIETNRLSSKERMFEIYMNIIEWGPMIYGANEASRYYFDKDAKDININEAIFLASIIPSPKRALNSFTVDYQLKPELDGYYRLLAQRFRVKGVISELEESGIKPEVKISESLKSVIDSLNIKK